MQKVVRVLVAGLVATLLPLVPGTAADAARPAAARPLVCVGNGSRLPAAACARTPATAAVREGRPAGTVVATVGSRGVPHARLRLVAGAGSTDNAAFALVRHRLVTRRPLDHEAEASYSVRIRASAAGSRAERIVRIRVLDRNDAPTGLVLSSATVVAGRPAGTVVGRLHATDPDGDRLGYRVTEGPFVAVGDELRTAAVLPGSPSSLPLTVVAEDRRGGRATLRTAVSVTPAPPTSRPEVHLDSPSVPEDAPTGTAIGSLRLTAPHLTGTPTFTLVPGDGDADNGAVTVDGDVLRTTRVLDHESAPLLQVRLRAADEGGVDAEASVAITVTDVEEAPSPPQVTGGTVPENAPEGSVVGAVTATDPDAGDTLTYRVDDPRFSVEDGELRTTRPLDHETDPTIDVTVTASDTAGLSASATVTVTVADVDEAPTAVTLGASHVAENAPAHTVVGTLASADPEGTTVTFSVASSVVEVVGDQLRTAGPLDHEGTPTVTVSVTAEDTTGHRTRTDLTVTVDDVDEAPTGVHTDGLAVGEHLPAGTLAGRLTATDPDAGDSVTLSLPAGEADDDDFVLSDGELRTTRPFDVDVEPTRTIHVIATDDAGLTLAVVLTVTVDDVNEAPGAPTLSASTVAENAAAGTVVGTVSAVDPDGNPLTFSVSGDDFTLTGNQLRTARPLDHETMPTAVAHVTVSDGQLSSSADLGVTVTDVDEAPTRISLSSATVTENLPAGTVVGTLSTDDPDVGDTFTYSVDDTARFAVVGDRLVTVVALDFEQAAAHPVRIDVADSGGLTATVQKTVVVLDANDAPVAGDDSYTGLLGNTPAVLGAAPAGSTPTVVLTGALPLANDTDQDGDTLRLQAASVASTKGGTVAVAADGSFTYVPPVGIGTTTDTFTYTVTDGEATATGRVTLAIGTTTWWVRAGAGGDGRAGTPLGSLTSLNGTGDRDAPGDRIYLFAGSYGALALESGQSLVGAGVALTSPVVPAGTRPVLTGASGTVLALAAGVQVDGVDVSATGSADAVGASAVATATVAAGTSVSATGTGAGVRLSGSASGDVTIAAPVTSGSTGPVVSVAQRTGGTVRLTGQVTSTAGGVSLSSGTGTVSFEGGLALSTGTAPAFTANGAGTVLVSGATNTLRTTAGTPLTVRDTTIGSAGLSFRSIASTGAANGIVLHNTGAAGRLSLTGDGGTGCAAAAAGCSAGTVTGSTGAGVLLESTLGPSITGLRVTGGAGDGIQASGVVGTLALADLMIDHNAGDGVQVVVPSGTTAQASVTSSRLADNAGDQAQLSSSGGALTAVVRDNDLASAAGAGRGILVSAAASSWAGSVQFDVARNTVSGQAGPGITVSETGASAGATFSGRVRSNTVGSSAAPSSCGTTGILVDAEEGAGALVAGVTGNTVRSCADRGIALVTGNSTSGGLQATVTDNVVASPGAAAVSGLSAQLGLAPTDAPTSCLSLLRNDVATTTSGQGIRVSPLRGQLGTPDVAMATPTASDVRNAWTAANPQTAAVSVDTPVTGTLARTACATPVTLP